VENTLKAIMMFAVPFTLFLYLILPMIICNNEESTNLYKPIRDKISVIFLVVSFCLTVFSYNPKQNEDIGNVNNEIIIQEVQETTLNTKEEVHIINEQRKNKEVEDQAQKLEAEFNKSLLHFNNFLKETK
jgi:hypothetical protein